MKLTDDLPRWVAWPLRLVFYAFVMFILYHIALAVVAGRLATNIAQCSHNTPPVLQADALSHTKQLIACLEHKNGLAENLLFKGTLDAINAMPNNPKEFVGRWRASQPRCEYEFELEENGHFTAIPQTCSISQQTFAGQWGVYDGQMVWLYQDRGPWQPDINPMDVVDKDFFLLTEHDGTRTRFSRTGAVAISPLAAVGAAPADGSVSAAPPDTEGSEVARAGSSAMGEGQSEEIAQADSVGDATPEPEASVPDNANAEAYAGGTVAGLAGGGELFAKVATGSYQESSMHIAAPDIAENGDVVPVSISFAGNANGTIWVFVDGNEHPAVAKADFLEGSASPKRFSTRVRMRRSGELIAAYVDQTGRVYAAKHRVKITMGAKPVTPMGDAPSFTDVKHKLVGDELKLLVRGDASGGGYVEHVAIGKEIEVWGSPWLARDPYFSVGVAGREFVLTVTGSDGRRDTRQVSDYAYHSPGREGAQQ